MYSGRNSSLWVLSVVMILLVFSIPSRCTLVVLVPTREGIVVCADRRQWNRVEGATDTDKLFSLDNKVGFAVIGDVMLSVENHGKLTPVFTLSESVKKFYAERHFKDEDSQWTELTTSLKKSFEEAHLALGIPPYVSQEATDDTVWEVDFIFDGNGAPTVNLVRYHLGGQITVESGPQAVYINGQTQVVKRIFTPQQLTDDGFADLRGHAEIARTLNLAAPGNPSNVSVDDAIVLAHTFIRAISERMHLVSKEPTLVGPVCDCAIVRKGSGSTWLQRSVDTRAAGLALPH